MYIDCIVARKGWLGIPSEFDSPQEVSVVKYLFGGGDKLARDLLAGHGIFSTAIRVERTHDSHLLSFHPKDG